MIPAAAPAPTASTGRALLLRVHLWLVRVIVDVVMALENGNKKQERLETNYDSIGMDATAIAICYLTC